MSPSLVEDQTWFQPGGGLRISTSQTTYNLYNKTHLKLFKGGKHSVNPRLVEDQREAQQRLSKKALLATNPTQVNLNEN